jgi:hypothetical protein
MPYNNARDATKAFFTSFDLHLNFTSGPLARVPSSSHPERVCVSPLPELSEIRDFPRSPVSLPPKPGNISPEARHPYIRLPSKPGTP